MAALLPEPAEPADPSAPHRARVLDAFPYPVAQIYRRVVEAALRLDPDFPWAVMLRQNLDAGS
jgi:hypothetical protein